MFDKCVSPKKHLVATAVSFFVLGSLITLFMVRHGSPFFESYVQSAGVLIDSRSSPVCREVEHEASLNPADTCVTPSAAVQAFRKANLEGSDKGTPGHSYDLLYGPFLAPLLHKPVAILEIGVEGGKSLKLWERLFPEHVIIVGIGFGAGSEVKQQFKRKYTEKHFLYTGSQADNEFLARVKADLDGLKFDLIIDDGSHVPWHQVYTLEKLFEDSLKDGGMYIVEDIETSYWDKPGAGLYGYTLEDAGAGKHGNFVEKMKCVADTLNRGTFLDPDFHVLGNKVDMLVSHILFSQNIVILWKKDAAEWAAADIQAKHIDSYQFGGENFLDHSRTEYKKWKAEVTWEIAGMQRP